MSAGEHEAAAPDAGASTAHNGAPAQEHPGLAGQRSPHGFWLYLLGLAVLIAAALGALSLHRARRAHAAREGSARTDEVAAGPRTSVAVVGRSPAVRVRNLTGEARPFATATLYAKISGYLRSVRVDRGDRVRAGQVLAVIESPETDQQLRAARREQAFRRLTAERYTALAAPGIVSRQEADTASASADVADATAAQLASQRGYEVLRAPFAGTITARYADPGALVQSATAAQTGALPIARLSQLDRLRVFVYLDQRDASLVRVGDPAELTVVERPGVSIAATITRLAGEVDPRTRTLLAEIDVDNSREELLPGGFVQVALRLRAPVLPEIPAGALVLRDGRTIVATLAPDDTVHFRPVTVADDDGTRARIQSGLREGERVALNLGDTVAEGSRVQPVALRAAAGAADAGARATDAAAR